MRPGFVNHSPQITRARRDPQGRARAIPRGTQRDLQTRARAIPRGTQETPGARCTRSPCATGSKHTVVTTGSPKTPGVSCAMVLTAYGALFPATNSSCHRHRRIDGVVAPGWARNTSAGLAPATGAGTTRFCRPQRPRPILRSAMCCRPHFSRGVEAPFVHAPAKCSRTFAQWKIRPATPCATTLPRPPHPIPTFVTIAIRPS